MRPPLRDDDAPDDSPKSEHEVLHATKTEQVDASTIAAEAATSPADLLEILDPIPVVETVDNPFGLSPRELLFVNAYVGAAHFRAAKAYELAGYKVTGAASRANASRMLTRPRVEAAIAALMAERVRAIRIMDGDEALEGISRIGRSDIRRLYPPDHWIAQLSDEVAFAIKSITPVKHGDPARASGYRIELYPKDHALETMAKAGGKLKETLVHEHKLEDILERANQLERGVSA